MNSKDHVTKFMLRELNLSRFDLALLTKFHYNYSNRNIGLSQKQDELWDKCIYKYRKQLSKHNLCPKELAKLKWKTPIVPDSEINNKTYLKVEEKDDKLLIRMYFKYNKSVINQVRRLIRKSDSLKYYFIWNPKDREWTGEFNPSLFLKLYQLCKENNVNIDNNVEMLYNKIVGYKDWEPYIKVVNNRLYINNINEFMYSALDKYNFTDISPGNREKIALAIAISPGFENNDINKLILTSAKLSLQKHKQTLIDYIKLCNKRPLIVSNSPITNHSLPMDVRIDIMYGSMKRIEVLPETIKCGAVTVNEYIDLTNIYDYDLIISMHDDMLILHKQHYITPDKFDKFKVLNLKIEIDL